MQKNERHYSDAQVAEIQIRAAEAGQRVSELRVDPTTCGVLSTGEEPVRVRNKNDGSYDFV